MAASNHWSSSAGKKLTACIEAEGGYISTCLIKNKALERNPAGRTSPINV